MTDRMLIRYKMGLDAQIRQALSQCAVDAAGEARRAAPYGDGRDGHLRDSIAAVPCTKAGARYLSQVAASNPHALYVELGTRYMAAQPYLRPAAQRAYQKMMIFFC